MDRFRRSERGAAAVEFALVLLPLLLLLLGIVEFSRAFYTQLRLQHAAQEVARTIALHHDDPGLLGGITDLATTTLDELIGDLDFNLVQMLTCSSPTQPDAEVELQQQIDFILPLPSTVLDSVTVAGSATMRCKG